MKKYIKNLKNNVGAWQILVAEFLIFSIPFISKKRDDYTLCKRRIHQKLTNLDILSYKL